MTTKLSTSNLSAETLAAISGPRISNVQIADSQYNTLDDTAANIGGGYIVINGQSFNSAAQVLIDQTPATSITWVSNTQIRAQVPAASEGTSRSIYVINPDGSLALLVNGLTYSAFPAWSTGSTLTSFEALVPISIQLSAPSANNYTLATSNTLPSSVTLYANGLIAGTVAANTTTNYNFTVIAKDNENQDTSRNFTLPITKNNEPAWVTAADLGSAFVDANYSNTLVATDLSNVTYSVAAGSSLPSTLTLAANGLLSGSVSAANTYSFGIVATDTANLSNTRTFSITIAVANDTYFKNTTLLLNGEANVTPFISDASANSFALTINGDTKPTLFNPYQGDGYYSTYLNGSSYVTVPSSTNSALNLNTGTCIEGWSYITSISSYGFIISSVQGTGGFVPWWYVGHDNAGNWRCSPGDGTDNNLTSYPMALNTWNHFALTNDGTRSRLFVNGVLIYTKAVTPQNTDQNFTLSQYGPNNQYLITGYLNSIRIIKGSANIPASYVTSSTTLGTTIFTTPTTPLTAVTGTSLLTCQSNRHIDTSTNAFTLTLGGTPTISPAIPFTASSSYSTYGSTYFDGTGDYLRIPDNLSLQFGSGNWTVEFWVNLKTLGNYRGFFSKVNDDSYYNGVCIGTDASGNLWITATNNGAAWQLGGANLYAGALKTDRWHHIAIVRNSNTITGYVDGVAGGTPQTLSGTVNDTGASFFIGSTNGVSTGQKMDGYISDFRFVKGTALYTTTFTPPTTPLTAIANTSLLTLQYNGGANNSGIIDNSNFNNIITRSGNSSQGTFSPYSVTGWSNYFNGSSDYLSIPDNTAFNFGTGDATVEFWFNSPGSSNNYPTMIASVNYNTSGSSRIGFDNTGYKNKIFVYINSGGDPIISSTSTIAYNTWAHIAIVRQGTSMKLYLNGALDTSVTISASLGWYLSNGGMRIGRGFDVDTTNAYFPGYLSNIRLIKGTAVYTSAFTPSTTPLTPITNTSILTCQSNRFIDNSPNSFTLTPSGTSSVQAFSPFGSVPEAVPISYSNYFDGTGDYLSLTNSVAIGSSSFTIEGWVYPTSTPSVNAWIYGYRNGGDSSPYFFINSSRQPVFGGDTTTYITSSTALPLNTWSHVAVVRNGTSMTMYVNGVSVGTATTSQNFSYTGANNIGLANGANPYYWTGYISNLRIVKGTAVYTSAFTPPTSPLTAIANTSLLTCQSTTIKDNSTNAFTITATGDTKPRPFNPFGYTAQSATSYTPSIHGGSGYFDGTGDYLYFLPSTSLLGSGAFTIEVWCYFNSLAGTQIIFDDYNGASNGWQLWVNSSLLKFYSGTANLINGSTTLSVGTWYHFAAVRSGTTITLYVNGVSDGTGSSSVDYSDTSNNHFIGAQRNPAQSYFNGYLSNLRIVKGAALYTSNFVPPAFVGNYSTTYPTTLLLNFNNGGIIDQHSTNVLETIGNTQVSTSVKKYNNGSIYFDGSGDYLNIPYSQLFNFGTGDFTVECWANITYVQYSAIISAMSGTITSAMWLLGYSNSGHTMTFGMDGSGDAICGADYTSYEGVWTHIAASRSGTTLKLFFNGTQVQSVTNSTSFTGDTANPVTIGRRYNNQTQYYMNGYIDDLRITKGYARYTSNFTAPTSALITK